MSEVEIKWKQTANIRRQYLCSPNITIHDILEEWPIYKQSFGHSLVCLFTQVYLELFSPFK